MGLDSELRGCGCSSRTFSIAARPAFLSATPSPSVKARHVLAPALTCPVSYSVSSMLVKLVFDGSLIFFRRTVSHAYSVVDIVTVPGCEMAGTRIV